MEQKIKQEAPATLGEALNHGFKAGIELNERRKAMRDIVAHRLHSCRNERKLTQQELAIAVDINHLTYRGYENCKSDIPLVYLVRLADYFGVSLDYLTGRTDSKTGNSPEIVPAEKNSTDERIAQLEKLVAQLMQSQNQ